MLRKGYWDKETMDTSTGAQRWVGFMPDGARKDYMNMAARHGFRMKSEHTMLIATNLPAQSRLLRETEYANVDLEDYLRRCPGVAYEVSAHGAKRKRSFGNIQRTTYEASKEACVGAGFLADEGPDSAEVSNEEVPF